MNIPTAKSVPGAGSIIVNEGELARVPRAVKVESPTARQAIEAAYRTMQLHLQSANSDPTAVPGRPLAEHRSARRLVARRVRGA